MRKSLYNFVVMSLLLFLAGCSQNKYHTFDQQQLNELISQNYLSPQIRVMELMPLVNVQVYLDTPVLRINGDGEPLSFSFDGTVDADLLGNTVSEPIPIQVTGEALLRYDGNDHTFYLTDLKLKEARVDLELAMIQALVIEQFQKVLSEELLTLPIIPLKEGTDLYQALAQGEYSTGVEKGKWVVSPADSEK
ncbi:DUF1439 domain-containing protein [Endozoicomonas numazuensis]|uniref:Lipoprotein n=1 Tax=Endozoicomonas numazuensis TaxID=1137799 RepID=A0A081NMB7_9GAMM|nr:DUF1439 domain-containing protein [Endozoicomonas numazuensis]KEQ19590.1 hypothetical protein GZ78_06725 [Endozoicomonas numazuensis]